LENISKIIEIVLSCVRDLADESDHKELMNANEETQLYGAEGELDSLQLVLLISNVEERISSEFGRNITLADEKAMSRKNSPFRSVRTLSDYVNELLKEGLGIG
jgi:acyl carrier protein